jgi:hypothetical protein
MQQYTKYLDFQDLPTIISIVIIWEDWYSKAYLLFVSWMNILKKWDIIISISLYIYGPKFTTTGSAVYQLSNNSFCRTGAKPLGDTKAASVSKFWCSISGFFIKWRNFVTKQEFDVRRLGLKFTCVTKRRSFKALAWINRKLFLHNYYFFKV